MRAMGMARANVDEYQDAMSWGISRGNCRTCPSRKRWRHHGIMNNSRLRDLTLDLIYASCKRTYIPGRPLHRGNKRARGPTRGVDAWIIRCGS
ncbi:hypothetical protein M413DRAFT_263986 [Hebeloma cylindrosporum]|uniref:Uncharacterized protein n=1 Tax=Hebeloma cylindrosporum TaxID=76867 RepID=A0A0C2YAG8_HEBCY|nr:hypothetical protein M413DRAFT_263986 [Hebeloma cylindrosporum h7]